MREPAPFLLACPADPCFGVSCPPAAAECDVLVGCVGGTCTYTHRPAGESCSVGSCDGSGVCGEWAWG